MKILYIFQICEIWKICPLFEIIDRLIDWCLTSNEQFFSYFQDDFWNIVAKYFNGPSMINNPQNRKIGKSTLKLNEKKKCHLFVSKTVSYKIQIKHRSTKLNIWEKCTENEWKNNKFHLFMSKTGSYKNLFKNTQIKDRSTK
jgi:hypothetical protein